MRPSRQAFDQLSGSEAWGDTEKTGVQSYGLPGGLLCDGPQPGGRAGESALALALIRGDHGEWWQVATFSGIISSLAWYP